ncbi:MAG: tetratricopeptide repeat protein [Bacteroidota bacterium]
MSDYAEIFVQSRLESIAQQLGYIDPVCLLLGLVNTTNTSTPFLETLELEKIRRLSYAYLKNAHHLEMDEGQIDVPTTIEFQAVLENSEWYCQVDNYHHNNGIYLLLGLTTFPNEASEILLKEGVLFEDIVHFFQEKGDLQNPIKKAKQKVIQKEMGFDQWNHRYMKITPIRQHRNAYIDDLYQIALRFHAEREMDQALRYLKRILELNSSFLLFESLLLLGDIQSHRKKYQKAIIAYDRALEINPTSLSAYFGKGFTLSEQGEYDQALACYQKVADFSPNDPAVYNNIGFTKLEQGRYVESIGDFQEAITLDPEFAFPHDNLGFAYFKLGKLELALEKINNSIQLDKGNSFAYKNRALVYLAMSEPELAREDLNLAEKYGYTEMYDDEVLKLKEQYFGKA